MLRITCQLKHWYIWICHPVRQMDMQQINHLNLVYIMYHPQHRSIQTVYFLENVLLRHIMHLQSKQVAPHCKLCLLVKFTNSAVYNKQIKQEQLK